MRDLVLTGEWHDFHSIIATMHYPNDDQMRMFEYLSMRISAELQHFKDSKTVTFSTDVVRTLIDSPSKSELASSAASATKRGIIAGDLLNAIFIMDHFDLDEPSLNKAVFCSKQYNAESSFGDGSPIPRSEKMIKVAWEEFGAVAHLWGAFRLNRAYPFAPDERAMFEPAHLQKLLGVAAMLQEFGLAFVPKRAKPPAPLLDANKLIHIPASIRPIHLKTERRPDRIEAWLKQYKAPINNAWG